MNRMNEKQFEEEYQIQSLRYLSLERMKSVIGDGLGISSQSFCNGCFGGGYNKELLDW